MTGAVAEKEELDKSKFEEVPHDLLKNLQESVQLLDEALCLKAAGMISDHNNQELGIRLQQMVENLASFIYRLTIFNRFSTSGAQAHRYVIALKKCQLLLGYNEGCP